MRSHKKKVIITGTSTAVSHIIKTILDRIENIESTVVPDMDTLTLGKGKADCVVINQIIADDSLSLPEELKDYPIIFVTNNEKILSEPQKYGLLTAIRSASGGVKGMELFSEQLIDALDSIGKSPRRAQAKQHFVSLSDTGGSTSGTDAISAIDFGSHPSIGKPEAASCINMHGIQLIAIGASTGGTDAIIEVVQNLPESTPPVVIVQHMPEGFTKMYSERLNKICRMSAKEAEDGDRLITGRIIVAHGAQQMKVQKDAKGYYITSRPGEKVSGHCPSVDVLFRSVAAVAGKNAVGVILTGMGRDGAYGLSDMKKAGAYTIGQDEESCVVYGMPGVAYQEGAVIRQAPLSEICGILTEMTR